MQFVQKNNLKLSITCSNYDLAIKLIELNVYEIVVGLKSFSCRFNDYFEINDIEKLVTNKKNTRIVVSLNNIFFEQDMSRLEFILDKLSKLNIDLLLFHDFAIPQIVYENKLNINLHYNPETLITSYGQFDFFKKNEINSLTLAGELTNNELKKIALENKHNLNLYIKIHGLGFIMQSRWPMISNFFKYSNIERNKMNGIDYFLIKESERKQPNLIYEDYVGTHMMTGYFICGIKKMRILYDFGFQYMIIDSLYIEDNILLEIVNLYIKTIDLISCKPNKYNDAEINSFYSLIKKISPLDISEHFFDFPKGLLHMMKEEGKNEK
ncbi:MAG: U32 family peptidase [Malacoplasma sp.]